MDLNPRWLFGGGFVGVMWLTGKLTIKTFLMLGGGLFGGFLYLLWAYQENLLYQPKVFPQFTTPQQNPTGYKNPSEQGLEFEDIYLTTEDSIKLHAWFIRPNNLVDRMSRTTLLFFHANAGNMGFRLDNIKQMVNEFKLNVFILSYRGYGNSEGKPNEQGLLIDGETAWKYLCSREDIDRERLIIFGRSLGGSVAIAMAAKHSPPRDKTQINTNSSPPYVKALIIENTFTSISSLVDTLFPILSPLKPFILRLDWPALTRIASVTCPILFLSGSKDEIVPASHMQALYDGAVNCEGKEMLKVAAGLHNSTWQQGGEAYIAAFHKFLKDYVKPEQTRHRGHENEEERIIERKSSAL